MDASFFGLKMELVESPLCSTFSIVGSSGVELFVPRRKRTDCRDSKTVPEARVALFSSPPLKAERHNAVAPTSISGA